MRAVQERFGKTDGVVALHAYQSFREGEVTPEQCHEIGVALARKVWGKRFQVLVATHMNTDNLHNHFVINSVSYLNVHSLRHTNASLLIAQGVDVRTVASLLGHAQASTTLDIYAHAFDKNKREAQQKLGKVIGL